MSKKSKAIFLDRDGTLIVDKVYLNDPKQVEFLPNSIEGLKLLKAAGFEFFIITNQSGVPRGLVTLENLNLIHQSIQKYLNTFGLEIRQFYFAPYMTDSDHPLRKPNPGMLNLAAKEYSIDLKASWTIGDRMLDVEAGHRAGTRSILVEGREVAKDFDFANPEFTAKDLKQAADFICGVYPKGPL